MMPSSSPSRKASMVHQHRVLIYTCCYNVLDGVTLTIRKIEKELLEAGHHVCVLTTKSGDMSNTDLDGSNPNRTVIFLDNAIPIPFLHDPNNPENSYMLGFSLSKTVRDKIAEFEPSIVHITTPDCTCLHLIQYARTKELPLMGTYHSNIPDYMEHYYGLGWLKHVLSAFFRHQYNFLQALYVPTPYIHRHLANASKMDKVTNMQVWGRGIDLVRFSPKHRSRKFRLEMGFSDDDVVLCWVGRLVPEKRPDIFAQVVKRLHDRGVPFKALVIGAGPCEEEVKSLPNTTFAGWMSGDQLAVAYASCDVFLFPSSVETFGNVSLEAASSGLPLVVEAGCAGHLVRHGVNGFACPAGDLEAFYDGALCLLIDHERRQKFAVEGRKLSLQFEQRTVCRRMLTNYSTVTDEFYCEYGGHHANRDRVYQKEHSFLGGNYPRPIALEVVECLFILLFRVMYQMAAVFLHVRESFVTPTRQNQEITRIVTPTPTTIAPSAIPKIGGHNNNVVSATPDASPLLSIKEADYENDIETQDENSDMQDIPVEPLSDDETETTASVGDEPNKTDPCIVTHASRLSQSLAIGFVHLMLFQFRMESHLKNSLSSCFKASILKRKRKNSSVTIGETEILRKRSDEDSSVSEDAFPLLLNPREDRLNMRRPNQVSLDV